MVEVTWRPALQVPNLRHLWLLRNFQRAPADCKRGNGSSRFGISRLYESRIASSVTTAAASAYAELVKGSSLSALWRWHGRSYNRHACVRSPLKRGCAFLNESLRLRQGLNGSDGKVERDRNVFGTMLVEQCYPPLSNASCILYVEETPLDLNCNQVFRL